MFVVFGCLCFRFVVGVKYLAKLSVIISVK
jgi:hypothetical protein